MIDVKFYNYSGEKERVIKDEYLNNELLMQCNLNQPTDVANPTLMIKYDGVFTYNYCVIEGLYRSYFITKITSTSNGLWELRLHVDVLQTYRNSIIYNTACRIERNESHYNELIDDNRREFYVPQSSIMNFPNRANFFQQGMWSYVIGGLDLNGVSR